MQGNSKYTNTLTDKIESLVENAYSSSMFANDPRTDLTDLLESKMENGYQ